MVGKIYTQVSLGLLSRQEAGVHQALYIMFPQGEGCKEAKTGGANKWGHVHIIICHFPVRANDFLPLSSLSFFNPIILRVKM